MRILRGAAEECTFGYAAGTRNAQILRAQCGVLSMRQPRVMARSGVPVHRRGRS